MDPGAQEDHNPDSVLVHPDPSPQFVVVDAYDTVAGAVLSQTCGYQNYAVSAVALRC